MLTENKSPNWWPKRSRLGALPIVLLIIFVTLCFCQGGTVTPIAFSIPTEIILSDDEDDDEGYDAPLPPLPIIDDYSSSESSSDEDESIEKKGPIEKAAAKKKIYDAIPADLLAELSGVKYSVVSATNKSQDSICEEASTTEHSLDLTDSHSEHSGNISNRHSYSEPLASDDTGSSEPKEDKTDSLSRKRSSTTLSASMDSICSDTDEKSRSRSLTSVSSKVLGPKTKRRKLVPAEAEQHFLQDPTAMHSGILYQKRRLGVWSKRYCKIINSRFKCYRWEIMFFIYIYISVACEYSRFSLLASTRLFRFVG